MRNKGTIEGSEVGGERGKGCPGDNEDWSACRFRKDIYRALRVDEMTYKFIPFSFLLISSQEDPTCVHYKLRQL